MKKYSTSFFVVCCIVFLTFSAEAKPESPHQLNRHTLSIPLMKIGKESFVKKTVISTKNRPKNNKQDNQKYHTSNLSTKTQPSITGKITIHIAIAPEKTIPKKDWLIPCKKK